jgi:hypothetical protein
MNDHVLRPLLTLGETAGRHDTHSGMCGQLPDEVDNERTSRFAAVTPNGK